MPDFSVKEVRLPELHLPEIKRDEIVRTLSGIHVPEVDLAKVEPRRRLRNVDLRALASRRPGMAGVDAGKVVAAAVAAARIARPSKPRSRWSPFRRRSRWAAVSRSRDNLIAVVRPAPRRSGWRLAAVVIAMTAAACWMLFRNPAFRARLGRVADSVRRPIGDMRSRRPTDVDLETGEPVSVTTADVDQVPGLEPATAAIQTDITEGATNPA